jgi:hypothetical protein
VILQWGDLNDVYSLKELMLEFTVEACSFCGALESDTESLLISQDGLTHICDQCLFEGLMHIQQDLEQVACDVYVSVSKIHGRGVYSNQYIRKGTYVGTYYGVDGGDITNNNFPYVIFNYDEKGEETGHRVGTNEFRFLNHSENANLVMDENWHFWAACNIKKDEELTWYYGDEFNDGKGKRRGR